MHNEKQSIEVYPQPLAQSEPIGMYDLHYTIGMYDLHYTIWKTTYWSLSSTTTITLKIGSPSNKLILVEKMH